MRTGYTPSLAIAYASLAACGGESFAPPPEGSQPIPVLAEERTRYQLLERETAPGGRVNAIVLMQFLSGRDGGRWGYQVQCAPGGDTRWKVSEAETLAALRAAPAADADLRLGDREDASQQIANWLCD